MSEEDQRDDAEFIAPADPSTGQLDRDIVRYAWVPDWIARHFRGGSVRARMAKGVAWSVITGGVTRGLFVLVSIIIARLLGEDAFGKWGMVQATVGVLSVLAGMGIGQTLTKHIAELKDSDTVRAGRVIALSAELALISNAIVGIGCLSFSGVIARSVLNAPDMAVPLAMSSFMAVAMVMSLVLQSSLAGFEAFGQIAFVRLAEMLATFAAMVLLTRRFGLVGAILGFSLGQVVSIVLFAWLLRGHVRRHGIKLTMAGRWQEIRLLWDYSLPSLLSAVVLAPGNWYAQALVAQRPDGFVQMSGFAASQRWRGLVSFIPRQVRLVALPVLSQLKGAGDFRRYRKAFVANLVVTAGFGVVIAVPLALASHWIMGLYGPGYVDKWDILVVLLAVSVVQSMMGVFGPLFTSQGKVWWSFWFNVLWVILLVAGSMVFVPLYGIRGFVWSLLGAYLIDLATYTMAARVLLSRQLVGQARQDASVEEGSR